MLGLGDLGGKTLQHHLGMDEPGTDRQPRPQVRPDAHHDDTGTPPSGQLSLHGLGQHGVARL